MSKITKIEKIDVEEKYYLAHRYDRWIRSGCAICWYCMGGEGHPVRMEADERKAHEWCRIWAPKKLWFPNGVDTRIYAPDEVNRP